MTDLVQPPADWTDPERWVWERIAAGEAADLNARDRAHDPAFGDLVPDEKAGWNARRRLSVKFLQTVLTQKAFADATPYGGVRILGALIDDASLNLEYARLQRLFWLESSRILTAVKWRNLRIDSDLSLEGSFVAGGVELTGAAIGESLSLASGKFRGEVGLASVSIRTNLQMGGSTFEKFVNLNAVTVNGSVYLDRSTFKDSINLTGVRVGSVLDTSHSTFKKRVTLNSAKVDGAVFLSPGVTFEGEVDLVGASFGASLAMTGSTFEKGVSLSAAKVGGTAFLNAGATFRGDVNCVGTSFGSVVDMTGSTFEKEVTLNSAKVAGAALLRSGATFKGEVSFGGASVGATLEMNGSTFEKSVTVSSATVDGPVFLNAGATFKGKVMVVGARLGSVLDLSGSIFEQEVSLNSAKITGAALLRGGATFKGKVNFVGASIGATLEMSGSTFEKEVELNPVKVETSALLNGSTFERDVGLAFASIGSNLDFTTAKVCRQVDLTGARVTGELRLGSTGSSRTQWGQKGRLVLRNTSVGVLQDWWQDSSNNSWPRCLGLEGFTSDRLAGMMDRPSEAYLAWLDRDPGLSSQPYEHLAGVFRRAGEPGKAGDILYEARERRRRQALWGTARRRTLREVLKGVSLFRRAGDPSKGSRRTLREVLKGVSLGLGLLLLRSTIGYGLGNRYFRVLRWVFGLSLLGTVLLVEWGTQSWVHWSWPGLFFASFDQLLPLITLNKAHDVLIFGDPSARPPVTGQPLWIQFYFYVHMVIGWVLGSFLVAGLAGLTQRN